MQQLFIDFKSAHDSVRRDVLYNILIEFGIPIKIGKAFISLTNFMRMCLTETYSRVQVEKHLSDIPIRNGLKHRDALSPFLFNFALKYTIRRVQVNQDGLKLNGTHQLLFHADDVNILGGSICTIEKNPEALVVASIGDWSRSEC